MNPKNIFNLFVSVLLPLTWALSQEGTPSSSTEDQPVTEVATQLLKTEKSLASHPLFAEPLLAISGSPSPEEMTFLLGILKAWDDRKDSDDYSSLESFVQTFPNSTWSPSIRLNLGQLYYDAGFFSRALESYDRAYQSTATLPSPVAKYLNGRAGVKLALMHARVGHLTELEKLVAVLKTRPISGQLRVQLERAMEAVETMQSRPEISFRCGPYALERLAGLLGKELPETFSKASESDSRGFDLLRLKKLAWEELNLDLRVIKRAPQEAVPVPSIVHFRCNHFGALLERKEDRFQIIDPTFQNETLMSQRAMDDESSGYFLVPADRLTKDAIQVKDDEAAKIFGKGQVGSEDTGATKKCDQRAGGSCPNGMASHAFHLMRASLIVEDTPMWVNTPYSGSLPMECAYHQREDGAVNPDGALRFSHLGEQWVFNWSSFLRENSEVSSAEITLYLPGGGHEKISGYDSTTKLYTRSSLSGFQLYRASAGSYELRFQDGSKHIYNLTTSAKGTRSVYLTKMTNKWGNDLNINYDTTAGFNFRIKSVTCTTGQGLYFFYGHPDDAFIITAVGDAATLATSQKKAFFNYVPGAQPIPGVITPLRLASITDTVGIVSSFVYETYGFMTSMTTPYGTTTFENNTLTPTPGKRWVKSTDPQGDSQKVLLNYRTHRDVVIQSLPKSPFRPTSVGTNLDDWNDHTVFYWSKIMWKAHPDDLTKAHAYHYLANNSSSLVTVGLLAWEKPPLQDVIWYNYPGQAIDPDVPSTPAASYKGTAPTPSASATIVEDENGARAETLSSSAYHATSGNLSESTTPTGLKVRLTHAAVSGYDAVNPGTDVTKVEVLDPTVGTTGTWRVLFNATNYQNNQPRVYTDEQGITTTKTFNSVGQVAEVSQVSNSIGLNATTGAYTAATNVTQKIRFTYTLTPDGTIPAWTATTKGYLRRIEVTHPTVATTFVTIATFDYDAAGRTKTSVDAEGYALNFLYDGLDRVTRITHPDATFEAQDYTHNGQMLLNVTRATDRQGRVSRFFYNALGQMTSSVDPELQVIRYEWCRCGDIKRLINANQQATTWKHDIQGRVTGKIHPDGRTETYEYYPLSGRLWKVTLPQDQGTGHPTYTLRYAPSGLLKTKDYYAPITPDVSLTYDWMGRPAQITDGLGTTTYAYTALGLEGAGQPEVINGPWTHDAIRFKYAHFGRLLAQENVKEPVTATSAVQQYTRLAYDFMGRVTQEYNDSGSSTFVYGATNYSQKVSTFLRKLGTTSAVQTALSYFPSTDATQRGRLSRITHSLSVGGSWTMRAQHDYSYKPDGDIATWRWQSAAFQDGTTPIAPIDRTWTAGYDAVNQLRSIVSTLGSTTLQQWTYALDPAGNRTYETTSGLGILSTSNNANQRVLRGGGGSLPVSGLLDQAASVTVNGQPATVRSVPGSSGQFRFEADIAVTPGPQTLTIAAHNAATPAQVTTQNYSLTIPAASTTYLYDPNGNRKVERDASTGITQQEYIWDTDNRLIKINHGDGTSTEFQHDGSGRRRIRIEKDALGQVIRESRYLWSGASIWQERDAAGRIVRKEHSGGVTQLSYTGTSTTPTSTLNYIVLSDHLGSRREVVRLNASQQAELVGRRDYDPYGQVFQVGQQPSPAAYTGHEYDSASGLHLTWYRAYDARTGAWLSADPIGERGGLNLYGYVGNGPLMAVDPLGLDFGIMFTGFNWSKTPATTLAAPRLSGLPPAFTGPLAANQKRVSESEMKCHLSNILDNAKTSDFDRGGKYHNQRFVDTQRGPVDLKHVTAAGSPLSGLTILPVTLGWETIQAFSGYSQSAFADEDLRSNAIGASASDASCPSSLSGKTFGGEAARLITNMGVTSLPYGR